MIRKLPSREQSALGLRGERDVDYKMRRDLIEVKAAGAFLDNNPDQGVTEAKPGDVVTIWSNTSFAPDKTLGIMEVHPALLKAGHCSFPRFLTEDHHGPVSVLFRCENEINLAELPYLAVVASIGLAYQ